MFRDLGGGAQLLEVAHWRQFLDIILSPVTSCPTSLPGQS